MSESKFLIAKCFQSVLVFSFRAYRWGSIPILQFALEMILTLGVANFKNLKVHTSFHNEMKYVLKTLSGWGQSGSLSQLAIDGAGVAAKI